MNKILTGLYIGNYFDSKNYRQLKASNITHIVSIQKSPRRMFPDQHYLCINASDAIRQNILQFFAVCIEFIHAARLLRKNVLIHCIAGMSRSVTIVTAYIMAVTDLNWEDALKVVRAVHSVSMPNISFQKQLKQFETTFLSFERGLLRAHLFNADIRNSDQLEITGILNAYHKKMQERWITTVNTGNVESSFMMHSVSYGRDVCNSSPESKQRNTAYALEFLKEQWNSRSQPVMNTKDQKIVKADGKMIMPNVLFYPARGKEIEFNQIMFTNFQNEDDAFVASEYCKSNAKSVQNLIDDCNKIIQQVEECGNTEDAQINARQEEKNERAVEILLKKCDHFVQGVDIKESSETIINELIEKCDVIITESESDNITDIDTKVVEEERNEEIVKDLLKDCDKILISSQQK